MRTVAYRVIAAGGALALVAFPVLAVAGSVSSLWSDIVEPGVLPLAFYLAGVVAFLRRPDNPATGRLMAFGAAHLAAYALASLAAVMLQHGWSGAWLVNLCAGLLYGVGFAVCLALFAVFPEGRYERRYEQVGTRLAVIGAAALTLTGLLARAHPDLVLGGFTPGHTGNPLHLASIKGLAGIEFLTVLGLPASVVFFTLRYRRARGERRDQMRWPLAVGLAGIATLVLSLAPDTVVPGGVGDGLFVTVFTLVPVSLVVGMLRHRLFDVELIVRRSVIFGALWAVIALLYVAVAAVLGIAAGMRLPTTVAVLVAVAAAMAFEPARTRLEALADRYVFGERRSGYDAIRELGARLERTLDLAELPAVIAATVSEGLGARWARVLITAADGDHVVAATGVEEGEAALATDLEHAGTRVGRIECGGKLDGAYDEADHELLGALARQAALAVRNARLASELAERLSEVSHQAEELRTSRARIVQAAETERRRIERDIHDGIQQEIVALMARIELARTQLQLDPDAVEKTLADARGLIHQTQADLRELARGIHPAVLGDRGLVEAIAARAARLPLAVDIDADPAFDDVRFAPEVEGAAYFVISEALANVMKHAQVARATVRLSVEGAGLRIEVADPGCGFDPGAVEEGSGLEGLRDRVQALGGSFEVISSAGAGTRVAVALVVRERERG